MFTSLIFCDYCGAANQEPAHPCFACGRMLSPEDEPSTTPVIAATFLHAGRYRILSILGQGGYGAVYKAADTIRNDQPVAIKSVNLGGLNSGEVIEATETFNRELALLSELSHPHLPHLHEHFSDTEHWYLVMDFIEGQSLETYVQVRGGRLPFAEVLTIGIQLCAVLDYLHTRQPPVIFRDVKPANILRNHKGEVFLIDFGIARRFRPGARRDTSRLGSPGYAAPEQYGRTQTSPQTDIYGLGVTLWHLLSGQDPASTVISEETLSASSLFSPLPGEFKHLLAQMLNPALEKRPASMSVVREHLRTLEMQYVRGYKAIPTSMLTGTTWVSSSSGASTATNPGGTTAYAPYGAGQAMQQQYYPSPAPPQKPRITRRKAIIGIAGAGVLAGVGGVAWLQRETTGSTFQRYTGHRSEVHAVAWAPKGGHVASGDENGIVHVWDAMSGNTLLTLRNRHFERNAVNSISWSPDGQSLLIGYERSVVIWDFGQGAATFVSSQINGPAAWSPNGPYIAAQGQDSTSSPAVVILNALSGVASFPPLTLAQGPLKALAWSPQSNQLATSPGGGAGSPDLQVWNIPDTGTPVPGFSTNGLQLQNIRAVAWSPDGSSISAGDMLGSIQSFSLSESNPQNEDFPVQEPTYELDGQFTVQDAVYALAWPPDSGWRPTVADATGTLTVPIYGDGQKTISTGNQPVFSISWSPDGKYIAAGSADTTVGIWQAPT